MPQALPLTASPTPAYVTVQRKNTYLIILTNGCLGLRTTTVEIMPVVSIKKNKVVREHTWWLDVSTSSQ